MSKKEFEIGPGDEIIVRGLIKGKENTESKFSPKEEAQTAIDDLVARHYIELHYMIGKGADEVVNAHLAVGKDVVALIQKWRKQNLTWEPGEFEKSVASAFLLTTGEQATEHGRRIANLVGKRFEEYITDIGHTIARNERSE